MSAPLTPTVCRPATRHACVEHARAWTDQAIEQQTASKPHGYVKVDEQHYHIATTLLGPIVSLLEWRLEKGENPGFAPVHNLYAVNLEARDKAVYAWENRQPTVKTVAENTQASAPATFPAQQAPAAPMKSTRTGGR